MVAKGPAADRQKRSLPVGVSKVAATTAFVEVMRFDGGVDVRMGPHPSVSPFVQAGAVCERG
jgi:hypothetical protein